MGRSFHLSYVIRDRLTRTPYRDSFSLFLQTSSKSCAIFRRRFSSIKEDELQKFGAYGKNWWNTKKSSPFPYSKLDINGNSRLCKTNLLNMRAENVGGAGPLHDINPVRVKYFVDQYCQNKLDFDENRKEKKVEL